MSLADEQWVQVLREAASAAQGAALEELGRILSRSLKKSFGRQLSESDLADITQDSLIKIVGKLDTFEGRSRFSTWAIAIAVHAALSELRRRKYQATSLAQATETGAEFLRPVSATPASGIERLQVSDSARLLDDAVNEALSEKQRVALLAELGGLPLMEIARRLQTSRGAVYKLLHDARKKLLLHFKEQGLSAQDFILSEGKS